MLFTWDLNSNTFAFTATWTPLYFHVSGMRWVCACMWFVHSCSYLCFGEHLHILYLCKNICIHVCIYGINVNVLREHLHRTMCMNTIDYMCISVHLYTRLCKYVQIIYIATCVHILMYWIIFYIYVCVCIIYPLGGNYYWIVCSASVGSLSGRDWNCKCSCHCLNMPEFVWNAYLNIMLG